MHSTRARTFGDITALSNQTTTSPFWTPQNLARHYSKRRRVDLTCMQEVFGKTIASITEAMYKSESLDVTRTAWIKYSAESYDARSSYGSEIYFYPKASTYVDDRLLCTFVNSSSNEIQTCYHEHFDKPHRRPLHKTEEMVKYIEQLGHKRRGNMIRNFSVEAIVPSTNEALRAEIDKTIAIPEKPPRHS
jgi:hypothetical protein